MITAIVSVVMFLVMVSLHEFGHFIVAKMLNLKSMNFLSEWDLQYSRKRKAKHNTQIRILPLGGYCKFEAKMKPTIPIRELFQIKSRGKDCLYFWQAGF